jgi:SAM-dependent methyltransferase
MDERVKEPAAERGEEPMKLSRSAKENGWMTYPVEKWNEWKPAPVDMEKHPFWTQCAEKYGGPILEVACGNGRWLIPLAEHGPGYEVVGVDVNKGFIGTARSLVNERKDAGSDIRTEFVIGDIVNLDLGRKFPLAIMTSWTWQVLLTQQDQIAFLTRLHEHLEPGGAFAFNVFMPEQRQLGMIAKDGRFEWSVDPEYHDGARRTYDAATQVETERGENGYKLRHTSLSELRLLFKLTGFEIVQMYGDDQDLRPFTGRSTDDYTILAERR